jgi:magnesium transporter
MNKPFQFYTPEKAGRPPGALIASEGTRAEPVRMVLIDYDSEGYFLERETDDLSELAAAIQTPTITWINVIGLHEVNLMADIGQAFGIHPLLLEDILNFDHRPKLDQYGQNDYLILKMLHWNDTIERIDHEQLSIVLGDTFVLTFQDRREWDEVVFAPLRKRLREGNGRLRKAGADYLAYAILDAVVDHYFLVLEVLGDQMEILEDELIESPDPETQQKIYALKFQLILFRKAVWPLRDILSVLQHGGGGLFQPENLIFVRDVYEHVIHVMDSLETYRDLAANLMDIYLSSLSIKLNEVMKVLTVIATLFIPLTFITSLYGMNFRYMPELQWRWGYPLVLVVMLALGLGMLLFFRRRRWI